MAPAKKTPSKTAKKAAPRKTAKKPLKTKVFTITEHIGKNRYLVHPTPKNLQPGAPGEIPQVRGQFVVSSLGKGGNVEYSVSNPNTEAFRKEMNTARIADPNSSKSYPGYYGEYTYRVGRMTSASTFELDYEVEILEGDYVPPAARFDDVPENRKAIKAEATAITKVCEAMLAFDDRSSATAALKGLNSFTVNPMTESVEDIAKRLESIQPILEAVQGLDAGAKQRVLRHAAHYYDIEKGATPLR